MYVCICHGVTDQDIRQAADAGCASVTELTMRTGLGSGCGTCSDMAAELLAMVAAKALELGRRYATRALEGRALRTVIVRPPKLVNIVPE